MISKKTDDRYNKPVFTGKIWQIKIIKKPSAFDMCIAIAVIEGIVPLY